MPQNQSKIYRGDDVMIVMNLYIEYIEETFPRVSLRSIPYKWYSKISLIQQKMNILSQISNYYPKLGS